MHGIVLRCVGSEVVCMHVVTDIVVASVGISEANEAEEQLCYRIAYTDLSVSILLRL